MSWLSDALHGKGKYGVRFDSRTLGNALKNAAPVAGTALGGVPGLLLAGGMGAGGEAARGKTGLRDMLKAGLSNAALAGGGQALRGAFSGGAGAAASPPPTPPPPPSGIDLSGLDPNTAASLRTAIQQGAPATAPAGITPSSLAGNIANGAPAGLPSASTIPPAGLGANIAGRVGAAQLPETAGPSWLHQSLAGIGNYGKDHPEVFGGVAQGLLDTREKSQQLDFQKQQYADEQKRRQQMASVLQSLFASYGDRQGLPQTPGLPTQRIPTPRIGG